MKTFSVELTKQQTKAIHKEWNEHGEDGGIMLAQTIINLGPFQANRGKLTCAILSPAKREAIQAILKI